MEYKFSDEDSMGLVELKLQESHFEDIQNFGDSKESLENVGTDSDYIDYLPDDPISSAQTDPFLQSLEEDFKNMFKITRSTFENLMDYLSKEEMEPIENIPLYKKLLIMLWLMGNPGTYHDAAEVFNVSEEAAENCFIDVCSALYNQSDNLISWPDFEESNEIASRIEKNYGFPGVVGILGCRYFPIKIPKRATSRRAHFNAKEKAYCVALQIVCDDNLVIRDVFSGHPGGVTEAQIFRKSPFCEHLTSKTVQLIESHKHILARSIYPQLSYMLTPYNEAGAEQNEEELELNELHESVCQLVDQTFELLQDRFSILKMLDPEVTTMILVVACVIHNFCVGNGDLFEIED